MGAPLGAETDDDEGSEGGAGGDDDDVSEGHHESSSLSSSDDNDEIAGDAAWIQRGVEDVHSYHIAEFDLSRVPEGVPDSDPPPELVLGPPPPAAPVPPPSKCDAPTLTEPVPPHA